MAEDVARAVGAVSPSSIKIGGKDCYPRPLSIKELTELERDCLSRYRRSYVSAYAENADLLGDDGKKILREKFEEAAKFTVSSLPPKLAYDPKKVKLNNRLEKWVEENIEGYEIDDTSKEEREKILRRLVATSLDQSTLTPELYENLTGFRPVATRVGYVNWWITGTFDGMISMVCLAFRDSGVTRDEIAFEIGRNPKILIDLSREIEHLSAPEVGNG